MRQIRYGVAMSLDGYIAGPKDEFDWIVMDPDIDFGSMMNEFDTLLMGRRTFEVTSAMGDGPMPGMKVFVVSKTLRPQDYPDVTLLKAEWIETVSRMRAEPGKDIWLFGGGVLFRSLLDAGLVDTVEVAVMPVLLGAGISLLPSPGKGAELRFKTSKVYEKTGIVALSYDVVSMAV